MITSYPPQYHTYSRTLTTLKPQPQLTFQSSSSVALSRLAIGSLPISLDLTPSRNTDQYGIDFLRTLKEIQDRFPGLLERISQNQWSITVQGTTDKSSPGGYIKTEGKLRKRHQIVVSQPSDNGEYGAIFAIVRAINYGALGSLPKRLKRLEDDPKYSDLNNASIPLGTMDPDIPVEYQLIPRLQQVLSGAVKTSEPTDLSSFEAEILYPILTGQTEKYGLTDDVISAFEQTLPLFAPYHSKN